MSCPAPVGESEEARAVPTVPLRGRGRPAPAGDGGCRYFTKTNRPARGTANTRVTQTRVYADIRPTWSRME
jgi:hypothetical protein